MNLEWVQIEPRLAVVASEERAWLHHADPAGGADGDDALLRPMAGPGSLATTRRLLDGVVAAAQTRAPRRSSSPPPITPVRWVWRLSGYYQTTHATPRLMAEAAARFAALGRHELAAYARAKVTDESGHDELALRDLRALGYPAERVVEGLVPPTAAALVALFTELVRAADPVGCVGYAYALERLAAASSRSYVERVEAALPPGVRATRSLRVHSAIGADVKHVDDAVAVAAQLPARDRIAIARAAYRTATLCASPPPNGYPTDEELACRLSALAHRP